LTHRFLPVYREDNTVTRDRRTVEKEYTNSAHNLAVLYGLTVPDISGTPYPLNIYRSYEQLKDQLSAIDKSLTLVITQRPGSGISLTTGKDVDLYRGLYYIPVYPAYCLLHRPGAKHFSSIVLSLLRYVYQHMRIPYYRNPGEYLHNVYDMIAEWVEQSEDEFEERADYRKAQLELRRAKSIGDYMLRKMRQPFDAGKLATAVSRFAPATPNEQQLRDLAAAFLDFHRAYPDRRFFDEIPIRWVEPDQDDRAYPWHYLSFIYHTSDWWCDQLDSQIVPEVQEYSVWDDPMAIQFFDQVQNTAHHPQDFQATALTLIDDFKFLLSHLNDGKY
jgi:hypothetical protein